MWGMVPRTQEGKARGRWVTRSMGYFSGNHSPPEGKTDVRLCGRGHIRLRSLQTRGCWSWLS